MLHVLYGWRATLLAIRSSFASAGGGRGAWRRGGGGQPLVKADVRYGWIPALERHTLRMQPLFIFFIGLLTALSWTWLALLHSVSARRAFPTTAEAAACQGIYTAGLVAASGNTVWLLGALVMFCCGGRCLGCCHRVLSCLRAPGPVLLTRTGGGGRRGPIAEDERVF